MSQLGSTANLLADCHFLDPCSPATVVNHASFAHLKNRRPPRCVFWKCGDQFLGWWNSVEKHMSQISSTFWKWTFFQTCSLFAAKDHLEFISLWLEGSLYILEWLFGGDWSLIGQSSRRGLWLHLIPEKIAYPVKPQQLTTGKNEYTLWYTSILLMEEILHHLGWIMGYVP